MLNDKLSRGQSRPSIGYISLQSQTPESQARGKAFREACFKQDTATVSKILEKCPKKAYFYIYKMSGIDPIEYICTESNFELLKVLFSSNELKKILIDSKRLSRYLNAILWQLKPLSKSQQEKATKCLQLLLNIDEAKIAIKVKPDLITTAFSQAIRFSNLQSAKILYGIAHDELNINLNADDPYLFAKMSDSIDALYEDASKNNDVFSKHYQLIQFLCDKIPLVTEHCDKGTDLVSLYKLKSAVQTVKSMNHLKQYLPLDLQTKVLTDLSHAFICPDHEQCNEGKEDLNTTLQCEHVRTFIVNHRDPLRKARKADRQAHQEAVKFLGIDPLDDICHDSLLNAQSAYKRRRVAGLIA